MEQTTQQTNMPSPKNRNIVVVIALIIVILLVLAWWWQMKNAMVVEEPKVDVQSGELTPTPTPLEDTTPVIQQDLQGINDINLDKELESINADLNNL
ncbi:MAG: hypothetical protein AB1333_00185 [Patescibacteria group bacterium]